MKRLLAALLGARALNLGSLPVDAKTLRWASQGDPQTADPYSQNESLTNLFSQAVHDTLVMRDKACSSCPGWRRPGSKSTRRPGGSPCARG